MDPPLTPLQDLIEETKAKLVPFTLFNGWWGNTDKMPIVGKLVQLWSGDNNGAGDAKSATDFLKVSQGWKKPVKIFWRAEYARMIANIEAARQRHKENTCGGVLITGQPGIGT